MLSKIFLHEVIFRKKDAKYLELNSSNSLIFLHLKIRKELYNKL